MRNSVFLLPEANVRIASDRRVVRSPVPHHRHEINAVYQRAKLVGRLCPRLLVAKLVVKSSDLLMIKFCQIGMPQGRWLLRIADFGLHRGFR
ncbi:MAG TPA: hypothetical protein DHE23_26510 [Agrobacterium sp.]|nr:hypothetical protein [Agrobacterium sp.]